MTEADIRRSLIRTWFPFFSRFGRLTEVQRRAIPQILDGRNVVVISPAASGKTEAVTAPAIERHIGAAPDGLAVLYVSPTRALVNDLFRRLFDPMEYLGLGLGRKTGDHPAIDPTRLPFTLITTPESFDSLLCRRPTIFSSLAAVLLDELHLLDNTPRGDQLRILLERLRMIRKGVQFCALSATIDDEGIGQRYFGNPVVVRVDEPREIEHVLLPMESDWQQQAIAELRARDCRKVLCFFNSRSWAESSVREFDVPPFRNHVWVHHASLSRRTREEVEQTMNRERTGFLCCTSTLELGIDIGDIDAVVLVRPPFDVSSLLQRIGRGNRRRASYLFALGFHVNSWERFLFETYLDCARRGELHEKPYSRSLAVIPQQMVSYLYQRRRIGTTVASLRKVLSSVFPDFDVVERVFDHMVKQTYIVAQRPGVYFLSPKLEKQVRYGRIHSNIQQKSFGKYEVVDASSKRHLGTVFFVFRTFVLGGRAWELVEFREKQGQILVRPFRDVGATTEVFEGTGTGGYGYRMAQVLKNRLFPGLAPLEFPWYEESNSRFLVHLLGTAYGFLMTEAFELMGIGATDMDGKLLCLPRTDSPMDRFPVPEMAAVREVVRRNLAKLEDSLGSGAFFRLLPKALQVEDHLLAFDVNGLFGFLEQMVPVKMPADEVSARIARVLKGEQTRRSVDTGNADG